MANRRVAGVAAGLSDFLGIDVTLIRVLLVLGTFFTGGTLVLIYGVLWIVLPQGTSTPIGANKPSRALAWVLLALVVAGGIGVMASDDRTPMVAIGFVILFVIMAVKLKGRKSWKSRKEFEKARLAWQRRLDEQSSQAAETQLGGNPFHIGSFYSEPPHQDDAQDPATGFQIQ